jgi:hypothetical protein
METPSRTRPVLGIDVGKRSRWACLVTAEGEIALSAPVANRELDLDELFSRAPGDALAVVDQVRNVGSLALRRAAGWNPATGSREPPYRQPRRPARGTRVRRTCSYSRGTPWSGAATGSATSIGSAGTGGCRTARRSRRSRGGD